MAQYNADIRIGVTGKTQLNQLESQLKRTQTTLNKLNKSLNLRAKVQAIKIDTRAATTAVKQLEQRINRLGRTITINVRTNEKQGRRSGGQSGGGAGGINTAALASVGAASTGVQRQKASLERVAKTQLENQKKRVMDSKEYGQEVQKVIKQFGELENIQAQLNAAQDKYNAKTEKIADLTRRRNAALGQAKSLQTRLTKGQIKNADAVKRAKVSMAEYKALASDLNSQIGNANKGYGNTNKLLERSVALKKQVNRAEEDLGNLVDKTARRQLRRQKIGKGAAAGAGVAGASALGSVPVLGDAVTGGLVASFTGGSVAAGALAGALVGLGVAAVGVTKQVTDFNNRLNLSQKALANTVFSAEELQTALNAIEGISDDFLVPIGDATQQFTKLNAAARASGFGVSEVEEVYRGLAAANVALGGDAERLNGILLATQQVFSKGKVQAEELRGQIGERLAGAFAKFAESAGLSTSELDKALEKGEVSLEDFVRFSKSLLDEYEEDAKRLAKEPENAAARLKLAMDDLQRAMGPILKGIGNAFTEMATAAVKALTDMFNAINAFMAKGQMQKAQMEYNGARNAAVDYQRQLNEANNNRGNGWGQVSDREYAIIQDNLARTTRQASEAYDALERLKNPLGDLVPSGSELPDRITPTVTTAGGGGGGRKGRTPAGPQDRTAELRIELELQEKLNALQLETIIGGQRAVEKNQQELEIKRLLLETEAERQRIELENTTVESKRLANLVREAQLEGELNAIAAEDAQRVFDRNEELKATLRGLQEQIDIEGALTNEAKLQAEWAARIADLQADTSLDPEERLKVETKLNQLYSQRLALLDPLVQYQRELQVSIGDTRGKIASLARTIESELGTALSNAITGLIDGTTTVEEAFGNMFANIGKAFIDMATQMLAQKAILMLLSAFTGNPNAATGATAIGRATAGLSFAGGGYTGDGPRSGGIDGQGGFPAILHPQEYVYDGFADARNAMSSGSSGASSSEDDADAIGGNTSNYYNQNSSSTTSSAQAFSQNSSSIARAFSQNSNSISSANSLMRERAVQREEKATIERAFERNSETTIGAGGSMVIETQVINNVEYASVEQVQMASAAAARQARAQVFSDMRNRPAVRAKAGLR